MAKMNKEQLIAYAANAAAARGLDPDVFIRQIQQESGFNPSAKSSAGALGVAQIVPKWHPGVDPMNPTEALDYAADLMASNLRKYGSMEYALAAYNGGEGAVDFFKKRGGIFHDPKAPSNSWANQTGNYVQKILGGTPGKKPSSQPKTQGGQTTPARDPLAGVPMLGLNGELTPMPSASEILGTPPVSPLDAQAPVPQVQSNLPGLMASIEAGRSNQPPPGFLEQVMRNAQSVYDPTVAPSGGLQGILGQGGGVAAPAVLGGLAGSFLGPAGAAVGAGLGGAFGEVSRGRNQDTREGKQTSFSQDAIRTLVGGTAALPILRGATLPATVAKNVGAGALIGTGGSLAEQLVDTGKVDVGEALTGGAIAGILGGATAPFGVDVPRGGRVFREQGRSLRSPTLKQGLQQVPEVSDDVVQGALKPIREDLQKTLDVIENPNIKLDPKVLNRAELESLDTNLRNALEPETTTPVTELASTGPKVPEDITTPVPKERAFVTQSEAKKAAKLISKETGVEHIPVQRGGIHLVEERLNPLVDLDTTYTKGQSVEVDGRPAKIQGRAGELYKVKYDNGSQDIVEAPRIFGSQEAGSSGVIGAQQTTLPIDEANALDPRPVYTNPVTGKGRKAGATRPGERGTFQSLDEMNTFNPGVFDSQPKEVQEQLLKIFQAANREAIEFTYRPKGARTGDLPSARMIPTHIDTNGNSIKVYGVRESVQDGKRVIESRNFILHQPNAAKGEPQVGIVGDIKPVQASPEHIKAHQEFMAGGELENVSLDRLSRGKVDAFTQAIETIKNRYPNHRMVQNALDKLNTEGNNVPTARKVIGILDNLPQKIRKEVSDEFKQLGLC